MTDDRTISIIHQSECGCYVSHAAADFPGDAPEYTVVQCKEHLERNKRIMWAVFSPENIICGIAYTEERAWENASRLAQINLQNIPILYSCRQVEVIVGRIHNELPGGKG